MVILICLTTGQIGLHAADSALVFLQVILGCAKENDRGRFLAVFAVPCKIEFGLILTGGNGYLGIICCRFLPVSYPFVPSAAGSCHRGIIVVLCRCTDRQHIHRTFCDNRQRKSCHHQHRKQLFLFHNLSILQTLSSRSPTPGCHAISGMSDLDVFSGPRRRPPHQQPCFLTMLILGTSL